MSDTYRTISAPSQSVFTEKRSKFLAFAFPVVSAAEAKEHVDALAKEYFDARHVCWAYMLGPERTVFRANDNGEPSGTAGRPILGQINSLELTDVVVIVVRYFGGIKLGMPGLIAAYRQASRQALEEAEIVERHIEKILNFIYPYAVINDVMKVSRMPGVTVVNCVYDNTCSMSLRVELDCLEAVNGRLGNIDGISIVPDEDYDNDENS